MERQRFEREIARLGEPAVLRGLVADWLKRGDSWPANFRKLVARVKKLLIDEAQQLVSRSTSVLRDLQPPDAPPDDSRATRNPCRNLVGRH